jgi:hypothetical protein
MQQQQQQMGAMQTTNQSAILSPPAVCSYLSLLFFFPVSLSLGSTQVHNVHLSTPSKKFKTESAAGFRPREREREGTTRDDDDDDDGSALRGIPRMPTQKSKGRQ